MSDLSVSIFNSTPKGKNTPLEIFNFSNDSKLCKYKIHFNPFLPTKGWLSTKELRISLPTRYYTVAQVDDCVQFRGLTT